MPENTYEPRGYLKEPFRIFHLKDSINEEFKYHYHDFDKIVIFQSGSVSYVVEGMNYALKPGDVLLIGHKIAHKVIIDGSVPYERTVLYIEPEFLTQNSEPDCDLSACFEKAASVKDYLIRPSRGERDSLYALLKHLYAAMKSEEFGAKILLRQFVLQLMVQMGRLSISGNKPSARYPENADPRIIEVIAHIDSNLDAPLSVQELAARAYMSKYHFMRKFKEITDSTVHEYIREHRLILAAELLREGSPAQDAAIGCGYHDYSAFHRAFVAFFGVTPSRFARS